jgi:hypothetical protein
MYKGQGIVTRDWSAALRGTHTIALCAVVHVGKGGSIGGVTASSHLLDAVPDICVPCRGCWASLEHKMNEYNLQLQRRMDTWMTMTQQQMHAMYQGRLEESLRFNARFDATGATSDGLQPSLT